MIEALLYELKLIVSEMESEARKHHAHTFADLASQAWGICRVYALAMARNVEISPEHQRQFDELEKRRFNAAGILRSNRQ